MLPALPYYNQELLLALQQNQIQNNLLQSNVLSHFLKMDMQINLLKLFAREATINALESSKQDRIATILNHSNQSIKQNTQVSKIKESKMVDIIWKNTPDQALRDINTVSLKFCKSSMIHQQEESTINVIVENSLKPSIPAFREISDEPSQLESLEFNETDGESLCSKSKKIKKINVCGHPERSHYAKNMCNQCYHKFGRTKKPWKCNHEKLYAHGLCQNCYISAYNKKRNLKLKQENTTSSKNGWSGKENDMLLIATMSTGEPLTVEPLTVEDKAAFGEFEKNQGQENQKQ